MLKPVRDSWIVLGIVALLGTAATGLVYQPQRKTLRRLQSDIATRRNSLKAESQKAAIVPDMLRRIHEMKSRYKDFDRRLPKQKELGGFLREISRNLAAEKLTDLLINPANPSREELFHMLPIVMRFKGGYLSLTSFLGRVAEMERLTRVRNLHATVEPKDGYLDIELQMNIYFTES